MMPPLHTSARRVMAKLFLIVIVFLNAESSHAFPFSRLRNLRNIQTKLKSTSSDELNAVTLKISAVEYCLINFGSIDIPETEEKIFVKMYQNFSGDLLSKKLDSLQAEKRYLEQKELKQLDILQAEKLNQQAEKLNQQAKDLKQLDILQAEKAKDLKQLDILQAEKAKDLELEKQRTIFISRDSSSGKLYMIIWG